MKISTLLGKPVAFGLAVFMLGSLNVLETACAQQAPAQAGRQQDTSSRTSQESSSREGALSVGGSEAAVVYPDAPTPQSGQQNTPASSGGTAPASAAPNTDPQQDSRPLGTAAAPDTRPTGVTGSRPAGAVIAPAKQRRAHSILISVGLLAGGAIAIGTVAALSKGSPSRP